MAMDGITIYVNNENPVNQLTKPQLKAIYTGPELLNQIDAFRADVDGGLIGYKTNPGNRVTTHVTEIADLTVNKTGPGTVDAGQNLTYTITVTNNGPSDASAVVAQDTLPAGVTFVFASNGGSAAAGVVTWPAVATLANGANFSRTVSMSARA